MSKPEKPWKRSIQVVERCRTWKLKICCFNRQTEQEGSEIVYFTEPGGYSVGRRTVENALKHGLLIPQNDGLFGAEFSQTYIPAVVDHTAPA